MADEPSFMVELLRKHPWGPALQGVALVGFVVIWFSIDPTKVASPFLKAVWFITFLSSGIGMYLTHKHSVKLQRQRRTRASARSPAPWDAPSGRV